MDQMFDGSAFQMVSAATEKRSTVFNSLTHARIFEKQFRWSKCLSRYALWYEICDVFRRHSLEAFESKQCDFVCDAVTNWQAVQILKNWAICCEFIGPCYKPHSRVLDSLYLHNFMHLKSIQQTITWIKSQWNKCMHQSLDGIVIKILG